MTGTAGVIAAEREFFSALVEGRVDALDRLVADDFVLIDVVKGSEVTKDALLGALGSDQLRFESLEPAEQQVRLYHATGVVTGRTLMRGRFGGEPFAGESRYTHVYVEQDGRWRLVNAQGTPIASGS